MSGDQVLPDGWRLLPFNQIAESITERVDDPSAAGVDRYVGLDHLDPESTYIRRWGSPDDVGSTKLRFYPGDVVYARRRAYQRKLGVADFEGICSAHALVLRARPETCLPEFLPYFLQSDAFHERALDISVGSLSPTINWKTLAVQEFIVPPVEAQRQIVEVLDACGHAIRRYETATACARDLLDAATEEVAAFEVSGGSLARLGDMIQDGRPIIYGILKPGPDVASGVPVIRVENYPAGVVEIERVTRAAIEIDRQFERSRLRKGDLLMSIRGTIGRVSEVPASLDGANISRDTARVAVRDTLDRQYVRRMLESNYVQRQITGRVTGLAVQGINIRALREVQLPAPPLQQQREVGARFDAISQMVDESQLLRTQTQTMLRATREHLLSRDSP